MEESDNYPDYFLLRDYAKTYFPKCFSVLSCKDTQRLHIIPREKVVPLLRFRTPIAHENDKLVAIVKLEQPGIHRKLGDFYIAEEVLDERTTNRPKLITAEIYNKTIGFMWLDDNLDMVKLIKSYELEAYDNLLLYDPNTKYRTLSVGVMASVFKNDYLSEFAMEDVLLKHCKGDKALHRFKKGHPENEYYEKMFCIGHTIKNAAYYHHRNIKVITLPINYSTTENGSEVVKVRPNAFAMKIIALVPDRDKRFLFDLLTAAFGAYPDTEYCLITLARTAKVSPTLQKLLRYFIRIPSRPNAIARDDLYLAHHSTLTGDIGAYPVTYKDISFIERFLMQNDPTYNTRRRTSHVNIFQQISSPGSLCEADLVHLLLKDLFENPATEYKCFIITCGNAAKPRNENINVGFIILRPFSAFHLLKKNFLLYSVEQNVKSAEILVCKLVPFYRYLTEQIMREVARHCEFWDFIYFRPMNCTYKPLNNDIVTFMQPIEPRVIKRNWKDDKELDIESANNIAPFQPIDLRNDKFAVFKLNLLRPLRLFQINKEIVVLGFTTIAKAFLRSLLFHYSSPDFKYTKINTCIPRFSNITVIGAPGAMEADYDTEFDCTTCSNQAECWVSKYNNLDFIRDAVNRMELRNYFNFLSQDVKEIKTDENLIVMENDTALHYESLLIFLETDHGPPHPPDRILNLTELPISMPANYAVVNGRRDRIAVYHKVKLLLEEFVECDEPKDYNIIVYGRHARAFEFINFLITHGVQPQFITLIMTTRLDIKYYLARYNCAFADNNIEKILVQIVEDLGVKVCEHMKFSRFVYHPNTEYIKEVAFRAFYDEVEVKLPCDLFVSYEPHYMSPKDLKLIKKSGIKTHKFDILIDGEYKTNIPNIYAYGNNVTHSNATNHQCKFVCAREVAEKFLQILGLPCERNKKPFEPKFDQPYQFEAKLPWNYRFIKLVVPKRYLANHLTNEFDRAMVTYDGNFCRVRLSQHGLIEEIVVVTREQEQIFDYYQYFVGKHEALLNNLHSRWVYNEIQSFVSFFRESWTQLYTYELFEEFRLKNREMIQEMMAEHPINFNLDRHRRREILKRRSLNFTMQSAVEASLVDFLREHREDFEHPFALPEDFPQMYYG